MTVDACTFSDSESRKSRGVARFRKMATMPNVEERRNTLRCPIIRIDVEIFCSVDLMLPYRFATARLILRPIAAADAPPIFAGYTQDPEVVRFLIWRPHRSIADTEAYISGCISEPSDQSRSYVV